MKIRLGVSSKLFAISVGLLALQSTATFAAPIPNTNILFNDLTDTVSVTVTSTGAGAPTTANQVCSGETCTIDVISPSPGNLFSGFSSPAGAPINILEPGSSIISDILSFDTYEPTGLPVGDFAITFTSDTNEITGLGTFTTSTPGGTLTETGSIQDGFTFQWNTPASGALAATATIQFASDLDSTTSVPEPSSLPILLAGLAVIGGALYLVRKKAKATLRAG